MRRVLTAAAVLVLCAASELSAASGGCDHAASARLENAAQALGKRGLYRRAIAAFSNASDRLAACPASDRAGRIGAYVEAAHAVIAGATLAASTPRGAADEARLVRRATGLRAGVNLDGADRTQIAAVQQADHWLELARTLPQSPAGH